MTNNHNLQLLARLENMSMLFFFQLKFLTAIALAILLLVGVAIALLIAILLKLQEPAGKSFLQYLALNVSSVCRRSK